MVDVDASLHWSIKDTLSSGLWPRHQLESFTHRMAPRKSFYQDHNQILLTAHDLITRVCVCVCVCVSQSWPTLCDPMYYNSLLGSSIHGILQARMLEWVAILFFRGSSQPKDWNQVSSIAGRLYYLNHQGSKDYSPIQIQIPSYLWLFSSPLVLITSLQPVSHNVLLNFPCKMSLAYPFLCIHM